MDHSTDERLDHREEAETTDLRGSALPELDPLAEGNEVQGHATAPGLDPVPTPVAVDWGETLVRQSLSDLENQMTADTHLDHGRMYEAEAPETAETEPLRSR